MEKFQPMKADDASGTLDFSSYMLNADFTSSFNKPTSPASHEADSFPLASLAAADAGSASSVASSAPSLVASIPQLADYLINGFWQYNGTIAHHWGSSTITYNINGLNANEQMLAQSALNAWHEAANLTFVQTSGAANITFNHNGSMTAYETDSYSGSGIISAATIDISADWITNDGGAYDGRTGIDSYGYQTYIHEIGHALGLGHQGPYNGSATYSTDAAFVDDTWQYSVMSYFAQNNYGGSYRYVVTPQMADIYAVQAIYGAAATRTGNTVYGFHNTAGSIYNFGNYSQAPALTIYDSGGTDTLDCSGYSTAQTIDLRAGAFSSIGGLTYNIGIALTANIENAIGGSGNDTLIASNLGCTLSGGSGADTLTGGIGNDRLVGGSGNDTIDGGGGADTAVFSALRSAYQVSDLGGGTVRITGPDGIDLLVNVESLAFIDQTIATPINHAPVATAPDFTATHNQNIAASSLFSVTDSDGDSIVGYQVYDSTVDSASGHWMVGGVAQGVNHAIDVTAAQLSSTTFQSGWGSDDLWVRANDGFSWGAWTEFHVNAPVNHAPVATAPDFTATHNQNVAASSLFSVTDSDGDSIVGYQVYDSTVNSASGHWMVGGVAQGVNHAIDVTAAQLSSTTFQSGSGSDDLWVRANEGFSWGAWTEFHVNAPVNHAPVATAPDFTATHNQNVAASSLFSVTDSDGDSIVGYQVYDSTVDSASGHWMVGGVAQGVNHAIDVAAEQLSTTTFQSGSGADDLWVRASDGFTWSAWTEFHVNAPLNHAPVVAISNFAATPNQSIPASSLFSVTDSDGDSIVRYQVYDSTVDPASGHWVVGGVAQGVNAAIDVTAAQLSSTTFQSGSVSDQLWVHAYDGLTWSPWTEFHL